MFVDSRLHISVRPSLEYKLPHAANAIKGVILGDHQAGVAVSALKDCIDYVGTPSHSSVDEHEVCQTEIDLRRLCTGVSTHMSEHLQRLSAEWKSHLALLWSNVQRTTDKLDKEVRYVKSVQTRYSHKAEAKVQRVCRNEFLRIETELDTCLSELRSRQEPTMDRPKELCDVCAQLKEAFPNAYGSMNTQALIRIKQDFEDEIRKLQAAVAEDFVAQTMTYVGTS